MNLNEMLEMLEQEVTSGMEKKASEATEESKETPAIAPQFTKSASARKEAEELGAKVAQTLLKQAEEESKAEEKKEEEKKDEEKSESKEDKKDEDKSESESKEVPNFLKKEENMDKKASLVDIITNMLEKSAFEGDSNTAAGIPEGVVPNKMQVDSAALVAEQAAVNAPTPGTDGANQGGTVNQILDAIVAKAQSDGAINPDEAASGSMAGAERNDENVEKTAAVVALVEAGVDFDQAVDLVKQAEVEIKAEEFEVEKQAAFGALIEAGVDFDSAIELVKEACEGLEKEAFSMAGAGAKVDAAGKKIADVARSAYAKGKKPVDAAVGAVKAHGKRVAIDAGNIGASLKGLGYAASMKGLSAKQRMSLAGQSAGELAKNRAVRYGAGAAAVAGGAAYAHQKKAAFDELIADGFDFDTAADLVKQACDELGLE